MLVSIGGQREVIVSVPGVYIITPGHPSLIGGPSPMQFPGTTPVS